MDVSAVCTNSAAAAAMRQDTVSQVQPRVLGTAVILLCCLFATTAFGGGKVAVVPPPPLPLATEPAPGPASFIDVEFVVSRAELIARLERALPNQLRSASRVDTAIADALDSEGENEEAERGENRDRDRDWKGRPVRWRGPIRRAPFEVAIRADTLTVTADLSWSVELLERGLSEALCGSTRSPLSGRIGCTSLIGWSDDWTLESRARPLPTRLSERCRPEPPGLDFTHRVNRIVEAGLARRLTGQVDSILRVVSDRAEPMRAASRLLARPVMIGDSSAWLRWNLRGTRVDPPRGTGESILMHVTFEVNPAIEPEAANEAAAPLSPPLVRLSGSGIHIPFDCWVEFEEIARDLATLPASRPDRPNSMLRVTGSRVTGQADRVAIALDLEGAVSGTAWLTGTLRVESPSLMLESPDLEWSAESLKALQRAAGPAAWPALRSSLGTLRDAARRRLRRSLTDCVTAWEKGLQDALQSASVLPALQGGISQREVGGVFCTGHAIGVRMIASGRARVIAGR